MNVRGVLRALLWFMRQPRSFYILGAGASYGLLPITNEMRRLGANEFHSAGIYLTAPTSRSPLFDRIIGSARDETDLQEVLLTHMPHGALELLTQRAL